MDGAVQQKLQICFDLTNLNVYGASTKYLSEFAEFRTSSYVYADKDLFHLNNNNKLLFTSQLRRLKQESYSRKDRALHASQEQTDQRDQGS